MPTGHYKRTQVHRDAIAAGLRRRFATNPEAKARAVKNLVHSKDDPRWKPADHKTSQEAKRLWWQRMSAEERSAFLSKRGAGAKKWWLTATPEQRERRLRAITENRKKATEASRKQMAAMSPKQFRARMQRAWDAAKRHKMSPEHAASLRKGQAAWLRNYWDSLPPEQREKRLARQVAAMVKKWGDTDHDQRIARTAPGRRAAQLANPSSLEVAVASLLTSLGISFVQQHQIGSYTVDFYIESRSLVIECDGDYWHNLPGMKEKDATRDRWLTERGYSLLRLPEAEIRSRRFAETLAREIA